MSPGVLCPQVGALCAFASSPQTMGCHPTARAEWFLLFFHSKVEIGLTSDGKTVVCYHPSVDFPYDLSQPIPRPDPLTNPAETHDQVLKAHLSKEVLQNREGPTIEELSKMFFTTKHRWYPYGQYHRRRKKMNPPKDR
ncbi:hypothetical protein Z043_119400 [Scleropages formosus]|uniref:Large ribosomal subunit protein mL42 n=1 Tax=Scleropages formosus TaxID=113540 RepID=A0A0P7U569_SCLFO|nr:hypothetical protein Z043_119400 [Scleropages formosus]